MKNIVQLFALSTVLLMVSCSGEPETAEDIVVNFQPEKTETIIIEKTPEKKGTTIVLDGNGVKVDTKKVDIEVKSE